MNYNQRGMLNALKRRRRILDHRVVTAEQQGEPPNHRARHELAAIAWAIEVIEETQR